MLSIVLLLSCLTFWLAYKLFARRFSYWESRGVPYLKEVFSLGLPPNVIFSSEYPGYTIQKIYDRLSPHPFGGIYLFNAPVLFLRDTGIIQNVLIKDFAYFRNRSKLNNKHQHLLLQNLSNQEGAKWQALRFKMSPLFSAMKMKSMFNIFEESSYKLRENLKTRLATSEVLDARDVLQDFTCDLIVSCVFGLDADDETCGKFRRIVQAVFPEQKPKLRSLRSIVDKICPSLLWILPPSLPKSIVTFLVENVKTTIEQRKKSGIQRNDFLNLLIELKNNKGLRPSDKKTKSLSDVDDDQHDVEVDLPLIVAQCFVFFLAGFENPSAMMTFALYELAIHQGYQDRLRTEITEVTKKHGNGITFEAIKDMKYLDQVVKETLRKYVTLPAIPRMCVKDYRVPGTRIVIERGTRVLIPAYALHYDENLFPDPHRFNPERFSAENEKKITPCSFLPFGDGPRSCVGMRFGLLIVKLGLVTILSEHIVQKTAETPVPLEMAPVPSRIASKIPIRLAFKNYN